MATCTTITLAIYIIGVFAAYFQILRWNEKPITKEDEYQVLFMLSMLSWLIFPVYCLAWLFRKCEER